MKTLIAVLSIVIGLLALALWKRDASARATSQNADAALAAVSNKLAEVTMKVTHQEQLSAIARTGLDQRARELGAMSNTVAALNADLDKARVEAVAARASARDLQARVAAADAQSAGLTAKLEELSGQIRSLQVEMEQARSNAARLESARFALANEAECLRIEKSELARQWNNPQAVHLQLRLLKSQAQFLEVEPDGSVRGVDAPR